ncbi:MAG TPA: complex I subunit 1 family protein [Syntrophomonadaceae bacterium]|nr:complex I subunit 1 family protein [Syntrophomonadaceae bacterium]
MKEFIIALLVIIIAPLLGGLLSGLDRVISARMQSRVGPPLMQPFYDLLKLLGKEPLAANRRQVTWALAYLFLIAASLVLFCLGGDLLIIVFTMAFAAVCFILGGFSAKSPYSHIGSQRELLQMLAYEPVLILLAVGLHLQNGSFMVGELFHQTRPLLASLPLVFIALLIILTIKMRKSPFDLSTSHHGHQELVKGITTEYSGPFLALIEITHWYELVLVLGLVAMFWTSPLWAGLVLAFMAFFLELVIDNICARLTWDFMLKFTWSIGLALCLINLGWILARGRGVM